MFALPISGYQPSAATRLEPDRGRRARGSRRRQGAQPRRTVPEPAPARSPRPNEAAEECARLERRSLRLEVSSRCPRAPTDHHTLAPVERSADRSTAGVARRVLRGARRRGRGRRRARGMRSVVSVAWSLCVTVIWHRS